MANRSQTNIFLSKTACLLPSRKKRLCMCYHTSTSMAFCRAFCNSSVKLTNMCLQLSIIIAVDWLLFIRFCGQNSLSYAKLKEKIIGNWALGNTVSEMCLLSILLPFRETCFHERHPWKLTTLVLFGFPVMRLYWLDFFSLHQLNGRQLTYTSVLFLRSLSLTLHF